MPTTVTQTKPSDPRSSPGNAGGRRALVAVTLGALLLGGFVRGGPVRAAQAAPTLTAINPASGPAGMNVTLSGANLMGATRVNFGATAVMGGNCNLAGTSCAVTAPAMTVGTAANVTLTTDSTSNALVYTFTAAVTASPTISTINPSSGSAGTSVTLTGANLAGATAVMFGSTQASGNCSSAGTSCLVTAPSLAAGTTANVTVATPGGTSNALVYTFGAAATIPQGIAATSPSGWNLVSGPAGTIVTGNEGPLYTYQAGNTTYQVVSSGTMLRVGQGYWAYFVNATTEYLPVVAPQTLTVALPAGQWIQIGNAGDTTASVTGADIVYSYSAGSSYQPVSSLSPGDGAWAISMNGGTATISNR